MNLKTASSYLIQDLPKILKYLKIERTPQILLDDKTEGFAWVDEWKIRIGLKDISSREWLRIWLIHELLHLTGMQHNYHTGYESTIPHDTYSRKIYESIFE